MFFLLPLFGDKVLTGETRFPADFLLLCVSHFLAFYSSYNGNWYIFFFIRNIKVPKFSHILSSAFVKFIDNIITNVYNYQQIKANLFKH